MPEAEVYVINERVLTDDRLYIAPEGFTIHGGYAAVVEYHTFQNANSDERHVRRFRSMEAAERFIVKRYGKTWEELVYGSDDDEESVRGCSCGMADYGAPGHDGDTTTTTTTQED